jgi:ethanolamine utilization microcompartment shell protein EutS
VRTILFRCLLFLIFIASSQVFGSGEIPASFNLAGKLFSTPTGGAALEESGIQLKIQIFNELKTCVLYEETQTVSTDLSEGRFSIQVGSVPGAGKRSGVDKNNSMATVFQNTYPILSSCGTTPIPAVSGSGRYARISVTSSHGTEVLTPEIFMGMAPSSLVAETLGGLTKEQFLQLGTTSELTQGHLENIFSATNYPILTALLAGSSPSGGVGSSSDYIITANNDNTGSGAIQFFVGSDKKAEITASGDFFAKQRIGIGDATPSYDLSFGGDSDRTMGLEREGLSNTPGHVLTIASGGAAAGATNKAGGDLYLASGVSTGTASSRILFQTPTPSLSGTADNSPITKMILDPLGYLGLGNTNPVKPLHVTSATAPTILLENTGAGTNQKRRFISGSTSGDTTWGKFSDDMATTTEQMRLLANGNLGVGVTNPGATIELQAGTTTNAPLKLNTGSSLLSPVDGTLEFDGTKLTFTIGGVRMNLAGGGTTTLTSTNFGSGSANAPGFAVSGDSDTGISSPAANTLSIDAGGVEVMRFNTAASAVNFLSVTPAATGSGPVIAASGADANVNLVFAPKGSGSSIFYGNVGVGNTNPSFKLDVSGDGPLGGLMLSGGEAGTAVPLVLSSDKDYNWSFNNIISMANGALGLQAKFDTGNKNLVLQPYSGSVGVRNSNPTGLLDIGGGPINGETIFPDAGPDAMMKMYRWSGSGTAYYAWGWHAGTDSNGRSFSLESTLGAANSIGSETMSPIMTFTDSGAVGFKTLTPSEAMEVNGNIKGASFFIKYRSIPSDGNWYKVASVSGQWGRIAYRADNPSGNAPSISSGDISFINDNFSLSMKNTSAVYATNTNLQFARSGNGGEPAVLWVKNLGTTSTNFYVYENQNASISLDGTNLSTLPSGIGLVIYKQLQGANEFTGRVIASGSITTPALDVPSGPYVDLNQSNTVTLDSVGGSSITLYNLTHGGSYTLLINDPTSRTYTFAGCTTSKFKPANGDTIAGTGTMYNIMSVVNGASTDCWITWASGYQ